METDEISTRLQWCEVFGRVCTNSRSSSLRWIQEFCVLWWDDHEIIISVIRPLLTSCSLRIQEAVCANNWLPSSRVRMDVNSAARCPLCGFVQRKLCGLNCNSLIGFGTSKYFIQGCAFFLLVFYQFLKWNVKLACNSCKKLGLAHSFFYTMRLDPELLSSII